MVKWKPALRGPKDWMPFTQRAGKVWVPTNILIGAGGGFAGGLLVWQTKGDPVILIGLGAATVAVSWLTKDPGFAIGAVAGFALSYIPHMI